MRLEGNPLTSLGVFHPSVIVIIRRKFSTPYIAAHEQEELLRIYPTGRVATRISGARSWAWPSSRSWWSCAAHKDVP